jgi:hypothetical protein
LIQPEEKKTTMANNGARFSILQYICITLLFYDILIQNKSIDGDSRNKNVDK